MKKSVALLGLLVMVSIAAVAQVEPAATGPARSTGTFSYSLHDTESVWWGFGTEESNSTSGSLQYANGRSRRPFSMSYSGGYTFTNGGGDYGKGYFQNLAVSQGFGGRTWRLNFNDDISYRPQSPTVGFSGIPGTGEPISSPPSTGTPVETVLTQDTHTINNSTHATFSLPINGWATSVFANGGYMILRFPDGNGIDTTSISAAAGASQRIDSRTSVSGEFQESKYSYSGTDVAFRTTAVVGTISHTWNKGFSANASVGPLWIASEGLGNTLPSSTHLSLAANLTYHRRRDSLSIHYTYGDNEGGGYFYGAQISTVGATYTRTLQNKMSFSARIGYQETSGLQAGSGSTRGTFASATTSRRLGRLFSIMGSYYATEQSASSNLPTNVLNGLLQGVSVSISYAPRGIHLEQ